MFLVYIVHVLVCVFLILVVLLQQGKGADLSVFGGGSTQTAFGARGATTLLHKLTVASFVIFILTTLGIGLPQLRGGGGTAFSDTKATGGAAKTQAQAPKPLPVQRGGAPVPQPPASAPAKPVAPAPNGGAPLPR